MQLKQLKLAGFKSFVDATTVHFPSQLVGIVGPNGCGKSNVIDAVRWVMGESSAKNLRGESMTDVIFNGSTNRKPVGQASVELVFDNSLGRLVGPFASYGEISVKRVVTKEGDSTYYLNGSRCRRKDITDIFLGTGAGARGYSIIGQGTISRIIEARPEELRGYIEEAAGVSKYKERRRETLMRIEHTNENLTRVSDISNELLQQLQRLERQAKAAERYSVLKEEEALCRANILALKWQDLFNAKQQKQQDLQQLTLTHEQQQSILTETTTKRTELNEQLFVVNDKAQQHQTEYYHLGTEITRLEEQMEQHKKDIRRLEQEKQKAQDSKNIASNQLSQDECTHQEVQALVMNLKANIQNQATALKVSEESLFQTQGLHEELTRQWQDVQAKRNQVQSELKVAQVKLQHEEQKYQQAQVRLEKIQEGKQAISLATLEEKKEALVYQQKPLEDKYDFDKQQLLDTNQKISELRQELQINDQQINELQQTFNNHYKAHATLVALQVAAKPKALKSQEEQALFEGLSPLLDGLQVAPDWRMAVEFVLGEDIHAVVMDDCATLLAHIATGVLTDANALTFSKSSLSEGMRLSDKLNGMLPQAKFNLSNIFAAESLDEALTLLPTLREEESVITKDGVWFGIGFVKVPNKKTGNETGVLARQEQIHELAQQMSTVEQELAHQKQLKETYATALQTTQNFVDALNLNLKSSEEALKSNRLAIQRTEEEHARAVETLTTLQDQEAMLIEELETYAFENEALKVQISHLTLQLQEEEQRYQDYVCEREEKTQYLRDLQNTVNQAKAELHQTELTCDREVHKTQQIMSRIVSAKERLEQAEKEILSTAKAIEEAALPEVNFQKSLSEKLEKHREIESALSANQISLSTLKETLMQVERDLASIDKEMKISQEKLGALRMEAQELQVRGAAIEESLAESKLEASSLLTLMPGDTTQEMKEEALLSLLDKIKRLGPINLAAIEEYSVEQQRKQYLDEQMDDLTQALATLNKAIEKMDEETKDRFENTFTQVNDSFKGLFPRLFGGGRAQLELTCDNLLEAGIVVMAQPPGKKNSTIHLLSGGEKAMTAVALVFAIFQLNPSPFCMLDEVDAPLDDVNVGRFCAMVKEMSQVVQFLFISHNKVTMELADHLIGVTMREPGVSRLVTVDVEEALNPLE